MLDSTQYFLSLSARGDGVTWGAVTPHVTSSTNALNEPRHSGIWSRRVRSIGFSPSLALLSDLGSPDIVFPDFIIFSPQVFLNLFACTYLSCQSKQLLCGLRGRLRS